MLKRGALRSVRHASVPRYLPGSKLRTDKFQKSLPRLPVPSLACSVSRYLDSQRPMLNDEKFDTTSSWAKAFKRGPGVDLQKALLARDKAHKKSSYIAEYWYDMYLRSRQPLLLHFNPAIKFNTDPNMSDQVIRATNMVLHSLRVRNSLLSNKLEPEVYHLNPRKSDTPFFRNFCSWLPDSVAWYGAYLLKAFPLDQTQYKSLFGTARIPRQDKDELVTTADSKHIVILRDGAFYTLDVLDSSDDIIEPTELYHALNDIIHRPLPEGDSIALYTTMERNQWADIRKRLVSLGNNADSLTQLDKALFVLCLDSDAPKNKEESTISTLCGTGNNRWFDKSFSLIVDSAADAAVNMEHAWGDGVCVVRYINEVYHASTKEPFITSAPTGGQTVAKALEFEVTPDLRASLGEARKTFDATVANLGMGEVECGHGMGKDLAKLCKLSPDATMQFIIQLAHQRLHGSTAATYESCSTAAFKQGRTETIRSCTNETLAASQALIAGDLARAGQLLQEASAKHGELTKNAATGQGWDRHLFALRKLSEEAGLRLDIFEDDAYKTVNHIILSTSTVASDCVMGGGFGPVTPNGYGIGYIIVDDRAGFNFTCYKDQRNAGDMVTALRMASDEVRELMEKEAKRK